MWHRARQFFEATRTPSAEDHALAAKYLHGELLALFQAQHPRDVVHAANTARWLIDRGHSEPETVAAALLHDIGKGHQRRLDRVAYVVVSGAKMANVVARPGSRLEVRRAIERSLNHSEAGAEALERAGAALRVVELTRRHHSEAAGDAMLALLQQADAES